MVIAKEFVAYLGRQLAKRIVAPGLEVADGAQAGELLTEVILYELEEEDRLSDEVRELLEQHGETMRTQGISYQEMFRKAKNTLMAQRKMVRAGGDGKTKISRDKINDISHKMLEQMKKSRLFRIKKDANEVRLILVKTITEILEKEEQIDQAARKKITSQKKDILEGSQEWEILHRRYYAEELKNYGIDLRA